MVISAHLRSEFATVISFGDDFISFVRTDGPLADESPAGVSFRPSIMLITSPPLESTDVSSEGVTPYFLALISGYPLPVGTALEITRHAGSYQS